MSLARNINSYLEENGIKKSFVCEKTGIKQNALILMLSERRRILADEYVKICRALGVPLETFCFENATDLKHTG